MLRAGARFDGVSADYKRRLWAVIVLNAVMFAVAMTAGQLARSQALQADALDFLGDALTYGISLAVIGASVQARTTAALLKGASLLFLSSSVQIIRQALDERRAPAPDSPAAA